MLRKFASRLLLAGVVASAAVTGMGVLAPAQASAATPTSLALLDYGKEYVGTPYRYGSASGKTATFDCSSFVQYVFKQSGVDLPRTSKDQSAKGERILKEYLSVGDLVFFKTNGKSISHVGIYAGNNKFLHASTSQGVTVTDINSKYWKNKFVTARRVL